MNILKQTEKGMLFLDANCGRLDNDYYIIRGFSFEYGVGEYILMKNNELVSQCPIIEGIITKYNTIKKLDEQKQNESKNNPPCGNN
jgi:hypothetical protein